jgi:hypothetical protein
VPRAERRTHPDHTRGHVGCALEIARTAARDIVFAVNHLFGSTTTERDVDHGVEFAASVRICSVSPILSWLRRHTFILLRKLECDTERLTTGHDRAKLSVIACKSA